MNTLELYQGLKTGKIKKTQLNEQQIGDVYKYMIDSKKVSVNNLKPETVKKFNLSSDTPKTNELYSPFKMQTNFNTSNYTQTDVKPNIKPIKQQSTNPENELVDLLSNLTMQSRYNTPTRDLTSQSRYATPTQSNSNNFNVEEVNPIANIKSNYGLGKLSEDENQAWSKYRATQSQEDKKIAQAITNEKEKYLQENETGKGNWITKDSAQYLPQQINQLKSGISEALPGALKGALTYGGTAGILGQAGPQAAIPEEIITVPAAASIGAFQGGKLGYMQGVAEYGYNNMAGAAYKNLLDLGVPNDIALKASRDEGIINSLIEGAGAGVDIATLGLGKLFSKGATTAAEKVVKNKLLSALKAYGINIASEGLEELSQEGVSIASEKRAMKQSGLERTATNEDDLKRMLEAGYGGVKIATVSGGGNAIGNIAVNTVNNTIANSQMEKYNQQIVDLRSGIDEDLKTLYNGMDNNVVDGNIEENIETTKQILEVTKKGFPELSDFFDSHIDRLNNYKNRTTQQPQTNENINGEQLVGEGTNVVQNPNNDVVGQIEEKQIQPIENVSNIETQPIENVQQVDIQPIEPIKQQETTMQNIADNTMSEDSQEINVTETKQVDEQQEEKPVTKLLGKKTIAKDNEGNAIEFAYEVVNADDLITSHDTSLNANQNYPKELQPRERTRTASQMQVNDIVNNLQPEFLGENPRISDGAPIVGSDNIVESGNGRTIALTKMYQMKHGNSDKYINWLKDNAEIFGINKDSLPENPVLVRRRLSEVNRTDFVKKANESSIATMSATETAKSDAEKLSINTLSLFMSNDNGIINTIENKNFIGKFIGEVVPKNEHNKYMTDKGELSQEGLARVKNAIFYKAYNDVSLMNKLSESLDNNTKNVTNALLGIAPKIVDIKTSIEKGELYNIDYSNDIAEAANEYIGLKETGKDVELYLQQESIFDNENTALIKDIIAIFNTNNRSVKKAMTVFNKLLDSVESLGNPNQINLFSEVETYNKVDVLEATLRRLEDEDNAQITLFQAKREESSGDIKEDKRKQTEKITDTATRSKEQSYAGEQSFKGSYTPKNETEVDMNRPLKRISDIKKDISKLFNISISNKTNKFAKRKALGYYKVMPEVIRTKYNNQLGVVMHELGHHLDKKYNFSEIDSKLIKNMIDKMDSKFKENYKDNELPGEAVAEFLKYYTTDTKTAIQFSGHFYNLFEQTLDKKDLKNIQDVRSDVLRWVNAEQDEKALSTIIAVNKDKKSFNEKVNAEEINMMLFDDLISLDRFSKTVENTTGKKLNPKDNPYFLALMTRKNSTIINGILEGDTIDSNLKVINNKDNLNKIIDNVGKDLNMFELYLKRKHALTLQSQGHQIFSNEIVLNQDTIDMMEKQFPNFKEQSERLYEWYDTFFKAWVIDTNMLGKDSKKIYKAMREQYPFYVPMFRSKNSLMGDKSLKTAGSNFTDQKSPVDRLSEKGSDRDTISPLDGIIMQVNRIVNAQTKNNVMRAIVEQYNNVDGLGMFIDRVKPDMEKKMIETQGLKNKLEMDFEKVLNPDDLEAIIDSIDDVLESYSPLGYSKDNDIITMIAEDGSRQFYEVFDANLLKSISNLNRNQLEFIDNILPSIRRSMTALTTGLNPIFGVVSNFPRDIQQAYAFGSYKNPFEYGRETAKALYEVLSKSDNYKEFMSTGGGQAASLFGADRKMIDAVSKTLDKRRSDKKINLRNSFDYIIESIETFNDLIETTPRLAEYNKAYKIAKSKGMNEYDAKLEALTKSNDVTLNFLKRGTIMNSTIAQSIPYLNAGLQGLDKLKRGLITDKETRKQTWGKVIVSMTLPTILLWAIHKDDEDYEKLSKGIKDNYWILWKNGDGSFVRIPKPKDIAGLFSADFERGLDALFKEKGADAFDGFLLTILNSLVPPMDTILRPINDVNKNKKWSGGTIVSQSLQGLTKRNQYDDTTSNIAITLSRGISKVSPNSMLASPKNMHYLIDQYLGGLGDVLLPMTTPNSYTDVDRLRDKYGYLALPISALGTVKEIVKRRVTADPSYSNDVINKFYDIRDLTMKANKSYDNKGDFTKDVDFAAEKEFKLYYNTISSYWKDIDYIGSLQNKQLSDSQVKIFKNLINYSRFEDKAKNEVIENLKNKKLNQSSITLLQKTIRDEIVNLADKALTEYKEYHKSNNEKYKGLLKTED